MLSHLKRGLLPAGLVVIAAVALITSLGGSAGKPYVGVENKSAVNAILSDFNANELQSDNVYQQQVVATWATKDLLEIIAVTDGRIDKALGTLNENIVNLQDDRVPRLLGLGVIAICWIGMWSVVPTSRPARHRATIEDELADEGDGEIGHGTQTPAPLG